MAEPPVFDAGRGGNCPRAHDLALQMKHLSENLGPLRRVCGLVHDSITALDGKIAGHAEQLMRSTSVHCDKTDAHIKEMRAATLQMRLVATELRKLNRNIQGLAVTSSGKKRSPK